VTVPAGQTITYDLSTAVPYGTITINGSLIFDQTKDLALTAHKINLNAGGTFQIGTQAAPYTRRAVITLNGPRSAITTSPSTEHNGLIVTSSTTRGFNSQGNLQIWGHINGPQKTKLVQHANAGATSLQVEHPLNWKAGDRIAISTTDFYGVGETEILTVAQDMNNSQTINLSSPLQTFRWGRLQYVCNTLVNGNHLSLVPCTQAGTVPVVSTNPATPKYLDQRATIVRLSRNITLQGANDADWLQQGFGATMMIMNLQASTTRINGLEFNRVGQRQLFRQYPFHWHMLSYSSANSQGVGGGAFIGDVQPYRQELMNSSIWQSENRGAVIHGTNGALIYNTYIVDVKGHAFFIEDGVERGNIILESVAMKARNPVQPIKVHEGPQGGEGQNGASCLWLTNPLNAIALNDFSDCQGTGIWNSFAIRAFGEARNTQINPNELPFGINFGNSTHGNGWLGMVTEFPVVDEAGNTEIRRYDGSGGLLAFNAIWKNRTAGYLNRVKGDLFYQLFTFADNEGRDLRGQSTQRLRHEGSLMVGKSLNSATQLNTTRVAAASYHQALIHKDIVSVNYDFTPPVFSGDRQFVYGGGALDYSDMYLNSINLLWRIQTGWVFRNSYPGFVTPAPFFDGFPLCFNINGVQKCRHWTLPVLEDSQGHFTGDSSRYLIPNNPFYTFQAANLQDVAPAGQNGKSTTTRFMGLQDVVINKETAEGWGGPSVYTLRLERLDNNLNPVGEHLIGNPANTLFLPGARHFSIANGGTYRFSFPDGQMPNSHIRALLANAYRPDDVVVMSLPWPGNIPVKGAIYKCTTRTDVGNHAQRVANGSARELSVTGNSVSAVRNDPNGRTIFQDTTNNRVWFKYIGGVANHPFLCPNLGQGTSDDDLIQPTFVTFQPASEPY